MDSLKGQFLIAMPLLMDPNFHRTVTCVCEHAPQGTLGVVINRQFSDLTADKIFDELKIEYDADNAAIPIHVGGPVHMDEIFILHGPPFGWKGTHMVTETLALSNSLDVLAAIARGTGPAAFVIALGSAGWAPGQLEAELRENAWLTSPVTENIIFKTPPDQRWDTAIKRLGIDPNRLSETAGHA